MSKVIAGGVGCSGDPAHSWRRWSVADTRHLTLMDELPDRLRVALRDAPIPGETPILTLDPWRLLAVQFDGPVLRLAWDVNAPGKWVGAEVAEHLPFTAAGTDCSFLWAFDSARRLWCLGRNGMTPIGQHPLPGTATPTAVSVKHENVLTDDGLLRWWNPNGGWGRGDEGYGPEHATSCRLFKLRDVPATDPYGYAAYRILPNESNCGFAMATDAHGGIKDVYPGDVVRMLARDAAPLLKRGAIEPVKDAAAS